MISDEEMERRFAGHVADASPEMVVLRLRVQTLARELNSNLPHGRQKSLCLTKLEECLLWAREAIERAPAAEEEA